jgi:flagellar hook assembly protein FlgD
MVSESARSEISRALIRHVHPVPPVTSGEFVFIVPSPARPAWKGLARPLAIAAAVIAVAFLLAFTSLGASANSLVGASAGGSRVQRAATHTPQEAAAKKAVIVVGPVSGDTPDFVKDATQMAKVLSDAGMNVTLLTPPHSTWKAVWHAANGADFFAYLGHGNGWPSPYPPFQEDTKDGLGLDPTDGANNDQVEYYGANKMRQKIHLAPNAIVLIHRLCYSAGNSEPGMALPNQDVAFQRVDNYASGFLSIGARVVFALAWQPGADLAHWMLSNHGTMDDFFKWTNDPDGASQYQPYHGWIGWKPNLYLDSVRTPGATVHLDPHPTLGYLRAVTGDLSFTFDQWWGKSDGGGGDSTPPALTDFSAEAGSGTQPAGGGLPVFTPNGDGIDDTLALTWTLSEAATIRYVVADANGNPVRRFTQVGDRGAGRGRWDGRNNAGNTVVDGRYTITATPTDSAGNAGHSVSAKAILLTTMTQPVADPWLFEPGAGGSQPAAQTQTVMLAHPATLDWVIRNANGAAVRTVMNDQHHAAGKVAFTWNGRNDAGQVVPNGSYVLVISATTSRGTERLQAKLSVGPYRVTAKIKASGKLKVRIVSAEPQTTLPTVKLHQASGTSDLPTVERISNTTFKAVTAYEVKRPGTLKVAVKGSSAADGAEQQSFLIPFD